MKKTDEAREQFEKYWRSRNYYPDTKVAMLEAYEAGQRVFQIELAKVTGLGVEITPREAADFIVDASNTIYDLREQLDKAKK